MTWGSNATFQRYTCRHCGAEAIDDRDSGPTSHEAICKPVLIRPLAALAQMAERLFGWTRRLGMGADRGMGKDEGSMGEVTDKAGESQ